jgi:phosphoglycerol transferase MdoB-like AlkP superfamily enzyme
MIPSFFRLTLQRIALLLGVYFVCRLVFLVWNWGAYSHFSTGDLIWAFVLGLRFDLSAIFFTNFVLLLLWMMPSKLTSWKWISRLELALFFVINWICIGSNIVDAEFVKFIGKRSGFDMLMIHQDLERQGFSLLWSYWYFTLLLTASVAVVAWLARPLKNLSGSSSWLGAIGWRLAVIALAVTGARGGFQLKPLHPMHAYFSTRHELGLLTLNTPFNVIKSRPRNGIERQRFFAEDREAILRLKSMTGLKRPPLAVAKNYNVVIILVESLSTEYMGAANNFSGYTPFLDSLSKEAYFYKYNFANSRRSIEGLPAVICGLPAIMAEPIITSEFSNNRYQCLPSVLSRRGYSTHFLHGAHNGSMHFDTFSKISGFEKFVGLNEYPKDNPGDFDPHWGVLDEPMLQHAVKVLDSAPKPSLVAVFTLSSHHPYWLPPQYQNRFPKGTLEIHETMGYADYAIQKFFEVAKSRPWFDETIFVITGDHTQKYHYQEYANLLGYHRVPLLIYAPGLKNKKIDFDPNRVTQQIDVVPSLLDLLGVELPDRLLVGSSVFNLEVEGKAYNFNSPIYWYIDSKVYMQMDRGGNPQNPVNHLGALKFSQPASPTAVDQGIANLKAVVHYLNEGLIRNNLYGWRSAL